MNHLYVHQSVKVKVNLDPIDLDRDYERKIKEKIIQTYGDKCYLNGYVSKPSIEIVKIENGKREGAHLHGFLTFHVEFSGLFCIPKRDVVIPCRITKLNKFGAMAEAFPTPMDIIIPRQLQAFDEIDKLKDLYEGEFIMVKVFDYQMENSKLVVIGIITEVGLPSPNLVELPHDGILSYDPQQILTVTEYNLGIESQSASASKSILGNNIPLVNLKDKITPFKDEWIAHIRKMINPYEKVDKYHRYGSNLIKYNDFKNIYDQGSLYPVMTRAYFKLWEVLSDTNVLEQYRNRSIKIANLAEGPGGFMQCLIDFRNHQHSSEWKTDVYHAITIKQDPTVEALKGVQDWDNYREGNNYFKKLDSLGFKINKSYGPTGDGNLISTVNIKGFSDEIGPEKCQIITGDGGIYLNDEEYGLQELENGKLFFAEILSAISNQAVGGCFILKIYDIYYDLTLQMLHLLAIYYQKITIIKPRTSRPANSEKYLVCENFKDIQPDQLALQLESLMTRFNQWIELESNLKGKGSSKFVDKLFIFSQLNNSKFISQVVQFNQYNLELQMGKINEGLELVSNGLYTKTDIKEKYEANQLEMGQTWCNRYKIPHN